MFRKGLKKKSLEDLKNESTWVLQGLMRLDIPFRCCGSLQIFIGDHCPVVMLLPYSRHFQIRTEEATRFQASLKNPLFTSFDSTIQDSHLSDTSDTSVGDIMSFVIKVV